MSLAKLGSPGPAWPEEPHPEHGRRFRVDQLGRAARAALITDRRTNQVVGPDKFEVADRIAAVLNASRTEFPVRNRREV